MRLLASAAVLAVCTFAATACSSAGTTASPAATQSEAGPVVSEPEATATPKPDQPSAPDPDDPSTWVLSDDGVGPYRLGMPLADALDVAPGYEQVCEGAFLREFDPSGQDDVDVWMAESDGTLGYLTTNSPNGPRTVEGLGVGSTTTDVLAAFPDATLEFRNSRYLRAGNMIFGFHSASDYDAPEPYLDPEGDPEEITEVGVTAGGIPYEFCG